MQKVEVHSTNASGGNIIPGREDGNKDIGNGSTYQIFRNAAATNSGHQQYFAKDKDGVVEPITGPGASGGTFAVFLDSDGADGTLDTHVFGGTAPFTYTYGRASRNFNGANLTVIDANSQTTTYNLDGGTGMAFVKVTDANGLIAFGYNWISTNAT